MERTNRRARLEELISRVKSQFGMTRKDVLALIRIDSVLHSWGESECNGERYRDDDDRTYWQNGDRCSDRETPALARASRIAEQYGCKFYYQSDPRGCQVHIYKPEDLKKRDNYEIDCVYNQVAMAVYLPH